MNKRKQNSTIFLYVLLTILIVAVIGFGGYFVWKLELDNPKVENNETMANQQEQEKEPANKQVSESEPEPEPEVESVETEEQYMASCEAYTYKEIARNPNNYKGKRIKITGEVIQVQQEGNEVVLRINMTKDQYGYYTDTIIAGYAYSDENEDRILENDIVTVYGEGYGTITYTSVLGANITVPAIKTMYLSIQK